MKSIDDQVYLKPCSEHLEAAKCFHNFGGLYRVDRALQDGGYILQHVRSSRLGVAQESDIRS